MPPASGNAVSPPARQRGRRLLLSALAILLIFVAALLFWVHRRGAPDYFGQPEALLPPDTAFAATWRNFSGFLEKVESLQAVAALLGDREAAPLLPFAPPLPPTPEKPVRLIDGAARDLVDTWLGREVTLALAPQRDGYPTAILVIARTRIGFEERVAELVAEYTPGVPLERERYRGHTLLTYRAKNPLQSFVLCRFGQTVIASLRSDMAAPVQRAVDRKMDGENGLPSLARTAEFAESAAWRATDGQMAAFVHPRRIGNALRRLPAKKPASAERLFWIEWFGARTASLRWTALQTDLDGALHIRSFWRLDGTDTATTPTRPSPIPAILSRLPDSTPVFFAVESSAPGPLLLDLRERMSKAKPYRKALKSFEKDWRAAMGSDLTADWLKPLGGHFGLALTGLAGGLVPLPAIHAWWDFLSAADVERIAAALPAPQLGTRRARIEATCLQLDWNRPAATPAAGHSLADHPLLRDIWTAGAPRPLALALIDLRNSYAELQRVEAMAALWSVGDREAYAEWRRIFAVARHFDALRLTVVPASGGVEASVLIAVR